LRRRKSSMKARSALPADGVSIGARPYYDRAVLRRDAKIELLKRIPLFAACSKAELKKVATITDEVSLREGSVLTKEGRAGHEFVVLIDGTARVTRKGEVLADLGPGDWLGEIALLTKAPRTATVTATSPIQALVITDRAFRQVVQKTPAIAMKVLTCVADRLAHDARS
jgi:CRP/FNR family cyclic AMP-dependent transcriptional regulator